MTDATSILKQNILDTKSNDKIKRNGANTIIDAFIQHQTGGFILNCVDIYSKEKDMGNKETIANNLMKSLDFPEKEQPKIDEIYVSFDYLFVISKNMIIENNKVCKLCGKRLAGFMITYDIINREIFQYLDEQTQKDDSYFDIISFAMEKMPKCIKDSEFITFVNNAKDSLNKSQNNASNSISNFLDIVIDKYYCPFEGNCPDYQNIINSNFTNDESQFSVQLTKRIAEKMIYKKELLYTYNNLIPKVLNNHQFPPMIYNLSFLISEAEKGNVNASECLMNVLYADNLIINEIKKEKITDFYKMILINACVSNKAKPCNKNQLEAFQKEEKDIKKWVLSQINDFIIEKAKQRDNDALRSSMLPILDKTLKFIPEYINSLSFIVSFTNWVKVKSALSVYEDTSAATIKGICNVMETVCKIPFFADIMKSKQNLFDELFNHFNGIRNGGFGKTIFASALNVINSLFMCADVSMKSNVESKANLFFDELKKCNDKFATLQLCKTFKCIMECKCKIGIDDEKADKFVDILQKADRDNSFDELSNAIIIILNHSQNKERYFSVIKAIIDERIDAENKYAKGVFRMLQMFVCKNPRIELCDEYLRKLNDKIKTTEDILETGVIIETIGFILCCKKKISNIEDDEITAYFGLVKDAIKIGQYQEREKCWMSYYSNLFASVAKAIRFYALLFNSKIKENRNLEKELHKEVLNFATRITYVSKDFKCIELSDEALNASLDMISVVLDLTSPACNMSPKRRPIQRIINIAETRAFFDKKISDLVEKMKRI